MQYFKKILHPALLILSLIFFSAFLHHEQKLFEFKISNVRKNNGNVVVEIYNSKNTFLKTPYRKLVLTSNNDVQIASFKVPYGKYAITIYQDLNKNGKPDMNFIGIPKELIGFGNNYKPFGEPKFESSSIVFDATSKQEEIKLYKVF